jgi:hypothetical protein
MGSQGMKRKGRQHLPKVGTRPENERVFHESQQDIVNFGRHPRRGGSAWIIYVAIAVVAVLALLGFIVLI